jgi:hypothetical protein
MFYHRFSSDQLGEHITGISLKVLTTKYWGMAYKRTLLFKSRYSSGGNTQEGRPLHNPSEITAYDKFFPKLGISASYKNCLNVI